MDSGLRPGDGSQFFIAWTADCRSLQKTQSPKRFQFAVAACVSLAGCDPDSRRDAAEQRIENQTGQDETPATADSETVPATASETSALKLQPGLEQHLDWSEPVNGLRAAVRIRTIDSPGIAGNERKILLVIQNVSDKPIRFCDTAMSGGDALKEWKSINERSTSGQQRDSCSGLSSAESTQTDVTLQPREVVALDLFQMNSLDDRGLKAGE